MSKKSYFAFPKLYHVSQVIRALGYQVVGIRRPEYQVMITDYLIS